jgi:cytochrome c553
MKKVFKILGILLLVIVIAVICIAAYVKVALPKAEVASDLKVERTPERIERGKYLANFVMTCTDCHTERDWTKYSGPLYEDSIGSGSKLFDQKIGLPGKFHSKNLTPYHLNNWTDGEILRAVTTGVSKDGKALFPLMPYSVYGKLDKEDIYSIIAYLRSLPNVKKDIDASEADFPVNFIINTMPGKASFTTRPDEADTLAYGNYLAQAAGCAGCHTEEDKGTPVPGKEFAGGRGFHFPKHIANSANLTPDETGLKNISRSDFIKMFKQYLNSSYKSPALTFADYNTPMPWTRFAHMEEKDLGAIYAYLRTVKPINNTVVKFVKTANGQ